MDGWKTIVFLKWSLFSGHSFIFRWGFHVLPFVWIPVAIAARCQHPLIVILGAYSRDKLVVKEASFNFSPKIGEIWHWSTILHQTKFSYHFKRRSIFSTQIDSQIYAAKTCCFTPWRFPQIHKLPHLLRFALEVVGRKNIQWFQSVLQNQGFSSGRDLVKCLKKSPACLPCFSFPSCLRGKPGTFPVVFHKNSTFLWFSRWLFLTEIEGKNRTRSPLTFWSDHTNWWFNRPARPMKKDARKKSVSSNWELLGCPTGSDRFTMVNKLVYFTLFNGTKSTYLHRGCNPKTW